MSDFMSDLSGILSNQTVEQVTAKHSTNTRAGKELEMNDFLQLMIAGFQNQTIDDVASTSDMMNQMMQMSVISVVTNLQNLVSQTTGLSYAASLVGKEVTLGVGSGTAKNQNTITGTVTGTGMLNGEQVIFVGDDTYLLSDVLSVGRLPSGARLNSNLDVDNLLSGRDSSPYYVADNNTARFDYPDIDLTEPDSVYGSGGWNGFEDSADAGVTDGADALEQNGADVESGEEAIDGFGFGEGGEDVHGVGSVEESQQPGSGTENAYESGI